MSALNRPPTNKPPRIPKAVYYLFMVADWLVILVLSAQLGTSLAVGQIGTELFDAVFIFMLVSQNKRMRLRYHEQRGNHDD